MTDEWQEGAVAAASDAFVEEERMPPARLACYGCGHRLYFSARVDGLGLCHPCRSGLRDRQALLTGIASSPAWRPFEPCRDNRVTVEHAFQGDGCDCALCGEGWCFYLHAESHDVD